MMMHGMNNSMDMRLILRLAARDTDDQSAYHAVQIYNSAICSQPSWTKLRSPQAGYITGLDDVLSVSKVTFVDSSPRTQCRYIEHSQHTGFDMHTVC